MASRKEDENVARMMITIMTMIMIMTVMVKVMMMLLTMITRTATGVRQLLFGQIASG